MMCYDRIKQKKLFWVLGSASRRRSAESVLVFRGRQAADSHERCCSAGFKRSTGSGGGKPASGA